MKKMTKKGVSIGEIYPAVLAIIMAVTLIAVGQIFLGELMGASASTEANTSINKTIIALGNFATWWPLIILAIAIGVVMFFILRAFAVRSA